MSGWKWSNPLNTQFRLNKDNSQARGLRAWVPITGRNLLDFAERDRFSLDTATGWFNHPTAGTMLDLPAVNGGAVGTNAALTSGWSQLSVSFWVVFDAFTSLNVMAGKHGGSQNGWVVEAGYTAPYSSILVAVENGADGYLYSGTGVFTTGTLYHICMVFDGSLTGNTNRLKVYVNGAQISLPNSDGTTIPATVGTNTNPIRIGDWIDGSRGLDGKFSDLRIHNVALSPSDVWQLFAPQTRWELYEPIIPQWVVTWAVGGGTTYNQSISGSITPTATLINQSQKVLVGSITPVASLINQAQKVLVGDLTPSGVLLNQMQKILSGDLTPTGALLNQAQKVLSGNIVPGGSLLNQAQKVLAGSVTPISTLISQTQKVLSGALTPSGVLTSAKTALISLVGSLTPSGTLSKETQKTLSGALSPVGSVLKQIGKILSGALTPIGSLVASLVSSNLESTFKGMFKGMFRRMK